MLRLLGVFEQICQTVAYAHARGVIHRDLKPANVMVGSFGEVQVMDWGLAKVLGTNEFAGEQSIRTFDESGIIHTVRSDASSSTSPSGSQTHAGRAMGTPAYVAPEQARGEIDELDERCDVFSLGAILCQMLTGQPAFVGKDNEERFRKAMKAELDDTWKRLDNCDGDRELIALARRCLEPDKERRPRDAGEVAAEITSYLESVQERLRQVEVERVAAQAKATEVRKWRRVQLALVASVLLLLLGASWAGWWFHQVQCDVRSALSEAEQTRRHLPLQKGVGDQSQELDGDDQSRRGPVRNQKVRGRNPLFSQGDWHRFKERTGSRESGKGINRAEAIRRRASCLEQSTKPVVSEASTAESC